MIALIRTMAVVSFRDVKFEMASGAHQNCGHQNQLKEKSEIK